MHVNHAGFRLVNEYFGLTVGQNIKAWPLLEIVISLSGPVFVLLLSLIMRTRGPGSACRWAYGGRRAILDEMPG